MGSMGVAGSGRGDDRLVISQVSFGGFDEAVTAKELADFLERKIGVAYRCRLKTSWKPLESDPDFSLPVTPSQPRATGHAAGDEFKRVPPHAFVHFCSPETAARAINAAGRCDLILNGRPLRVSSDTDSSSRIKRRRTTDPFKFPDVRAVEAGALVDRNRFLTAWKCPSGGIIDFVVDPFDGRCRILFSKDVAFSFKGYVSTTVIKCNFKVEFLVRDIDQIELNKEDCPFVLLLRLATTPLLYYRTADDDVYESFSYNLLDDDDPWIRTTDFTRSGAIGRCNSYRILISPRHGFKLDKALRYMRGSRIPESPLTSREIAAQDEPDFGLPRPESFFCIQSKDGIGFPTLFMVNAVVHKGIINQHQLSEEFFSLLRSQNEVINDTALRHLWALKHPVYNACNKLKSVQDWLLRNPKLLRSPLVKEDYTEVRRLVITPTKAHCLPPEVELSNRVLRKYKDIGDRFLRVTFMDEGMQQLNNSALNYYVAPIVRDITSNSFPQKTTVFQRVKGILHNGFHLCGRKYSFLAFSSNQLRDRSAWFFAEDKKTNPESIRKWMGRFSNKNVAKCAARMGQCFSSTYATVNVPANEVDFKLEDVKRNNYIFSDGIGKIAPELAKEVAEKLQLTGSPPSAYQIRYAGCKGVVAVWEGNNNVFRMSVRDSMRKFESNHTMLEVVSWTRFQPGFLNRQIVTLLSALNVQDVVFERMQDSMVGKLDRMLVDTDVAFEILTTSCAEQGNTAAMMLSAGFKPQMEPHLKGMLSCVRSAQLGDLMAKSRIFVPKGRWLMGCLDEEEVLEQGQCFIQASLPSLENCFLNHGPGFSREDKKKIILGTVVIAKNPCLHPGDIRILEAVDSPSLHHLIDCLVFPQKGDRPHANEASGSDLDGDLYFVTWDDNLIPPGKKSWLPMDYTAAETKERTTRISNLDILDFYLKTMVNENLGVICNAHVVHADLSEYGALDENCLKLAEQAAVAVDFPKTGKSAVMPHELKPKVYPDYMGKDEIQSYKSEKILGRLYRKIKDAANKDDEDDTELRCKFEDIPYDLELEIPGASEYLGGAWQSKCAYDAQLNALLGQYRVHSEGEIVTGHIWSLSKYNSRKQGELKERLKNAYYALHKEFRRAFEAMDPDFLQLSDDEKSVVYEKKASAWYQVTYHPRWVNKSREMKSPEGDTVPARLSFAWIAADYLVRIKVKCREEGTVVNGRKPIDSLARYLRKRI